MVQNVVTVIWYTFIILVCYILIHLFLSILFVYPYWGNINRDLSGLTGRSLDFGPILIIIVLVPLLYFSIVIYNYIRNLYHDKPLNLSSKTKLISVLTFLVYSFLYKYFIDSFDRDISIVKRTSEAVSPIYFLIFNWIIFYLIIEFMFGSKLNKEILPVKLMNWKLLSIILLLTVLVPFILLPRNVSNLAIGPRPDIIAHNGAGHLAPQGTIQGGEIALSRGATIWELDLQISKDGIPIVFHDASLKRTTNVKKIFPEKKDLAPYNFTLAELKQLDAGSWYIETDPYRSIRTGLINDEELESFKNIQIPTLQEAIDFSIVNDLSIFFQFKNGDNTTLIDSTLAMFINSSLPLSKLSITQSKSVLDIVEKSVPEIVTYLSIDDIDERPTIQELTLMGYDGISFHYEVDDDIVPDYIESGFKVHVWGVYTKIIFSQLWIHGVTVVSSDRFDLLLQMKQPFWHLTFFEYAITWIMLYSIEMLVIIFLSYKNKRKK